jgi:rhodanese-related sulfurtransferase
MQPVDILSSNAWDLLENDPNSLLIDVRTDVEWQSVGKPQLTREKQLLLNSLKLYPLMNFNKDFVTVLERFAAGKSKLFFLCRYGSRSFEASSLAIKNGFDNCYNIIDGFDGNEYGLGWRNSKLPIEL